MHHRFHRRIPPNPFEDVKEHLQDLLGKGVIQPSQSDYASPFVLFRKKVRCPPYVPGLPPPGKDAYPLPKIEESFDALGGTRYFSAINLASAYNQVEAHPDD